MRIGQSDFHQAPPSAFVLQEGAGPFFFSRLAASTFYRNEGPVGNWLEISLGNTLAGGTSIGARVTCHAGSLAVHRRLEADAWRGFQPPRRLRTSFARSRKAASPATSEPTGAPRPLDRQIETESAQAAQSAAGMPEAATAFARRAPTGSGDT